MTHLEEKVEQAEKRIKELELLIREWKKGDNK
jgi:hypothetical protein